MPFSSASDLPSVQTTRDCEISCYSSTRSAVLDGIKYNIFHMGSLNIINIRECRITYSIARNTFFMTFLMTFLIISPRVRNGSLLSASFSGTSGVCSGGGVLRGGGGLGETSGPGGATLW